MSETKKSNSNFAELAGLETSFSVNPGKVAHWMYVEMKIYWNEDVPKYHCERNIAELKVSKKRKFPVAGCDT